MRELFVLKNGETVLVREATTPDALELSSIIRELYGTSDQLLTSLAEFNAADSLNAQLMRIQHYQRALGHILLVAEVQGHIVGTLDFTNGHRQRIAHTGEFGIGISPRYQNKGIGRRMIKVLLDWAAADPVIEKIKLTTFATNHNGLHLFKSLGFIEEGRSIKEIKVDIETYIDVINLYKNVK